MGLKSELIFRLLPSMKRENQSCQPGCSFFSSCQGTIVLALILRNCNLSRICFLSILECGSLKNSSSADL